MVENEYKVSSTCLSNDFTDLTDNVIALNLIRKKLENFKSSIIFDMEKRMTSIIDETMEEIRQNELQIFEFKGFAKPYQKSISTWNNRRTEREEHGDENLISYSNQANNSANIKNSELLSSKGINKKKNSKAIIQQKRLPEKVFVTRESYLTALLEVDHMKTIYHIFNIMLLGCLINSVCFEYLEDKSVKFGLPTFKSGLNRIHYVFGIWIVEHLFLLLIFYAIKYWAVVRLKLSKNSTLQGRWSRFCLMTYITSQLAFAYITFSLCFKFNLPYVSASVLLLESTRLLMKMHAFVRTIASRVVIGKLKDSEDNVKNINVLIPPLSCYIYYLFAPTFIYRDHYPRTSQIRWSFAISRLLEIVAISFLYAYIHEHHIKPHFSSYGQKDLNLSDLLLGFFNMILPSIIIFLCGFYLILHSWLNFTSELLRFGDRMFYKDWWTSSTYDAYYRNWNVVVHDWLYEYIYKDFYNFVFKGSKVCATLSVFTISAVVHELLIGIALQVFFPIMFLFFGVIGIPLVFLTRKAPKSFGNIFIWFSLIFGQGALICLYSAEYYARLNCPKSYNSKIDYFIPAVWSCYNK